MRKSPLAIALIGMAALSLSLASCGDDDPETTDDTTSESTTESDDTTSSTTEEPTTTTTEEPTTTTTETPTTAAAGDVEACEVVTPEMVTALLGEAPEGQPTADGGCAWEATNGNVMGASLVGATSIPEDAESTDILPLFDLPTSGYRTVSTSRTTSGENQALVIIGYAEPQPDDEASKEKRSADVNVIADALLAEA